MTAFEVVLSLSDFPALLLNCIALKIQISWIQHSR